LRVIWPILSGLLSVQLAFGLLAGYVEGWSLGDSVYFTYVTGLTIGFGDLTPGHFVSRLSALIIGLSGILFTALVAAVGVRALQEANDDPPR